jgi:GNAT superfamily N-acetyltransferase
MTKVLKFEFHPLTSARWSDFEKLFGPRGACGGCWCLFWKKPRKLFITDAYEGNRIEQKRLVAKGTIPGIIAYHDGEPAGWCAVEPRENYPALERSRILKPVDEQPVWSVTCFYVDKKYRNCGVSIALLKAAIDFVSSQGGKIIEGYPVEVIDGKSPPAFIYTGVASAYKQAGFIEVARRSEKRPIYRFFVR